MDIIYRHISAMDIWIYNLQWIFKSTTNLQICNR